MSIQPRETGYLHGDYVRSFDRWGEPLNLPDSGGWLLRRNIPGEFGLADAMGAYPLFCCHHWARLGPELGSFDGQLVSTTLVTDPMAEISPSFLREHFHYVAFHKDHFLAEMTVPASDWVNPSHRKHALQALKQVDIDVCDRPVELLDEWVRLYAVLAERHGIHGLRRLTPRTLERQLSVPGLIVFRASVQNRTIGLDLWYVQNDVAHGHLVAFDATGYRLRAAYATKWFLLDWFRGRVRWVNLGGGRTADLSDGLSQFKRGFANITRPSWICGRIGDPDAYARLTGGGTAPGPAYFPAYRAGELT